MRLRGDLLFYSGGFLHKRGIPKRRAHCRVSHRRVGALAAAAAAPRAGKGEELSCCPGPGAQQPSAAAKRKHCCSWAGAAGVAEPRQALGKPCPAAAAALALAPPRLACKALEQGKGKMSRLA